MKPRYGEMTLNLADRNNKLQQLVSPNENDAGLASEAKAKVGLWVHQDTWFHLGKFEKGKEAKYDLKKKGNGVYAFVISGDVSIDGEKLNSRDGLGIWETDSINIKADSEMEILLMEVPMNI